MTLPLVQKKWIADSVRYLALAVIGCSVAALPGLSGAAGDQVSRGHYITHYVSMCVQCHSPRDGNGEIIVEKEFMGAAVPVEKPGWSRPWAAQAPNIRGLAGWQHDEAVHLLTTGVRYSGYHPQPPMPPFQMSREDAEAVVAYLKSLQ